MVIITTSHPDGQSSQVQAANSHSHPQPLEDVGNDVDEPPIPEPGLPGIPHLHQPDDEHKDRDKDGQVVVVGEKVKKESIEVVGSVDTLNAGDSVVDVDLTTWDGDADRAHLYPRDEIAGVLGVDARQGLTSTEASSRLERDGPNRLEGSGQISIGEVLLRQVSNALTIVLLAAMALSYGTMDFIEGAVISAVILLNIVLGFIQDFKAEKAMQSLLSMAAPEAKVIRDAVEQKLRAENLVVGDIVSLETGDVVPADVRIISSNNLEVAQASLTGESESIPKHGEKMMQGKTAISIGERLNMAYSTTEVTSGRGIAVVVAVGSKTQVGIIAAHLGGKKNVVTSSNPFRRVMDKIWLGTKNVLGLVGTPLQVKLSKFAMLLFLLAALLAIIVFSASKWQLDNDVVLYGICVAVAVIPESLIAVITITIAVGASAMSKVNVVIRYKPVLEAVGGVTDICSDKTGTLTQGQMSVNKVWIPGMGILKVDYEKDVLNPHDGIFEIDNVTIGKQRLMEDHAMTLLKPLLDAVALCNSAEVYAPAAQSEKPGSGTGKWTSSGKPTDVALQVFARRFDSGKADLLRDEKVSLVVEHQFNSTAKKMSVAYKDAHTKKIMVYVKGAFEAMLPALIMTAEEKTVLSQHLQSMEHEALRVICVATQVVSEDLEMSLKERDTMESGLTFHGLVGIFDPPREESLGAVEKCHQAGIVVHMLTGDALNTATAIAKKVGILRPHHSANAVMKAQDFDKLSEVDIDAMPSLPLVIARCSPETKVKMVDALGRRGAFCAMTGDGVNDAPALERAPVGIAMGIAGTDVAKGAADMVLTDDNFASIVKAIEEGRRLFDNIQKFLMHLLVSNIAQVILLLVALAFKDDDGKSIFPLSPLEILWVNMITCSFLALGLGMEEAQADIMTRPPRDGRVGVFTWELIIDKMVYGSTVGTLCLIAFIAVVYGPGDGYLGVDCNGSWNETCDVVYRGRATVYATLSFLLLVTAWEVKHFSRSVFNLNPTLFKGRWSVFQALGHNRKLLWAVIGGFVITFPVIYIPTLNTVVFKHKGITWEWGIVVACFFVYLASVEGWKALKRRFRMWEVDQPKGSDNASV